MKSVCPQKRSGGSASLIPPKNSKQRNKEELNERALQKVVERVGGQDILDGLRLMFQNLEDGISQGSVYETADGMLLSFMGQGYSERDIRLMFRVGGHRCARLRAELKDPAKRQARLEKGRTPWHAATEDDINRIRENAKEWENDMEDGFACSHRRIKKSGVDFFQVWAFSHEARRGMGLGKTALERKRHALTIRNRESSQYSQKSQSSFFGPQLLQPSIFHWMEPGTWEVLQQFAWRLYLQLLL